LLVFFIKLVELISLCDRRDDFGHYNHEIKCSCHYISSYDKL